MITTLSMMTMPGEEMIWRDETIKRETNLEAFSLH